jgi:hypothetical protein
MRDRVDAREKARSGRVLNEQPVRTGSSVLYSPGNAVIVSPQIVKLRSAENLVTSKPRSATAVAIANEDRSEM